MDSTSIVVDNDKLPSQDDVEFYREHGYYVSQKILPEELIDTALHGVERHFLGDRDFDLPISAGFSDWHPGDPETFRNVEFLALRNIQIRALALFPTIGAIASRLAGTDTIRLWDDQLVWKDPARTDDNDAVIGWHTDRAYWMTCTSEEMLTAWIPLHDCPEDMGPLLVIDGSHRWAGVDTMRKFKSKELSDLDLPVGVDEIADRTRVLALEKGQVSFHHCRTIHGSDSNRAQNPRVSLAVHLQDGPNRWRRFLNAEGIAWELVNDRLAGKSSDGTPDYTDPATFPVIWSRG
jgi:hypothetical protein